MAAAKKLSGFKELMEPDLKKVYLAEMEMQRRRDVLRHYQEMMLRQERERAEREWAERKAYDELQRYPEFKGETMPADGLDPIYLAEDAILLKETQKAVMVAFDVVTDFWIPKSALHSFTTIGDGRPKGKLVVKKWFAQKAGLL